MLIPNTEESYKYRKTWGKHILSENHSESDFSIFFSGFLLIRHTKKSSGFFSRVFTALFCDSSKGFCSSIFGCFSTVFADLLSFLIDCLALQKPSFLHNGQTISENLAEPRIFSVFNLFLSFYNTRVALLEMKFSILDKTEMGP